MTKQPKNKWTHKQTNKLTQMSLEPANVHKRSAFLQSYRHSDRNAFQPAASRRDFVRWLYQMIHTLSFSMNSFSSSVLLSLSN